MHRIKQLAVIICVTLPTVFWACCAGDSRTLIQYLVEQSNVTIFKCRILSTITDSSFNVTSKALVLDVFFGEVTGKYITLNTGNENSSTRASKFPAGMELMVYTSGKGSYFHCGGICDQRTHALIQQSDFIDEEKILRTIAKAIKHNRKGSYFFKNNQGKLIAQGKFSNGKPVDIWAYYDDMGRLQMEQNYTTNDFKYFDLEGNLVRQKIHYADSSVYLDFIRPKDKTLRIKEVDFPNDTGFVAKFYDYFPDGKTRSVEQTAYLKKKNGTSTKGKTGQFRAFHENGKLRVAGNYEKDRRVGIWQWYEENGDFMTQVDYKDGSGNQ